MISPVSASAAGDIRPKENGDVAKIELPAVASSTLARPLLTAAVAADPHADVAAVKIVAC